MGDTTLSDGDTTAFGRLLAAYREELGWTKTQLAERAGLDPSSVSRLEGGSRTPERSTIDTLAAAMKLTPVERERLLASADFRSDAWNDPLMVELVELTLDPAVPPNVAADIRTLIRIAVEHGRRGRQEGRGTGGQ
jgi:transcriptional regulator with XRE-family HTH domain